MACRYKFSEAEIQEIEQVRAKNKDKRVEARLKALELRAKGASLQEVSNATSLKTSTVTLRPMLNDRGRYAQSARSACTTHAVDMLNGRRRIQ